MDDQYSVDSTSFELQTQPYTTYMVTVAAATIRGQGPFSTEEIVTTPEDCESRIYNYCSYSNDYAGNYHQNIHSHSINQPKTGFTLAGLSYSIVSSDYV